MAGAALTLTELDHLLATFNWDPWLTKMADLLGPSMLRIAVSQGQVAADGLKDGTFAADDPFLSTHFTSYLARRISQIDETTRATIRSELQRVLEDSEAIPLTEVAERLSDAVLDSEAFSPSRAQTIARTETATAYNVGAVAAYRQNDIAKVQVNDGDGCDDCAEVDGEIWTLDEALAEPLQHPNCVRSFAPVVEDESE